MNQSSARRCSQCGSPLILVSKKTELMEGNRFSQTTSIFRCSDKSCQESKDREAEKRMKFKIDKDLATEKRVKDKQALKESNILKKQLQNQ